MKNLLFIAMCVIGTMVSCSKNRETKFTLNIITAGEVVLVKVDGIEISAPYEFVHSGDLKIYVESTEEISDIMLKKDGKGKALGDLSLSGISGSSNYYRMLTYYP